MLSVIDFTLVVFHLVIIVFNCFGWIWHTTRKLHLYVISITAFSWFIMGYWYGWGYCFLTDWAWQIKSKIGVSDLPGSFIQYCLESTGINVNPQLTDTITAFVFFFSLFASLYFNARDYRRAKFK